MLKLKTHKIVGVKSTCEFTTRNRECEDFQEDLITRYPKKGDGADFFRKPDGIVPTINFPSTRFYGSKRRHLTWLCGELSNIKRGSVLDAFGGTGAVSYLFSKLGFQCTYNDIFEFNCISARALFSKTALYCSEEYVYDILGRVSPKSGFIENTFSGLYYTNEENQWLDGFMSVMPKLPLDIRDLLMYCLFQACLKKRPFNLFHRANLGLRKSSMPVKFGNRSTWEKSFSEHIIFSYREIKKMHWDSKINVEVGFGGDVKKIKPGFDVIYLDPPYFKKRRKSTESYLQRYHFLEGLARYEEWAGLIDENSSKKSFRGPYRDEWTDKHSMLTNLKELFDIHKGSVFLLSYVAGEDPDEKELFDLFSRNFNKVRLSRRPYNKALSKKDSFEILLTGQ